jgi:hypothetical protein
MVQIYGHRRWVPGTGRDVNAARPLSAARRQAGRMVPEEDWNVCAKQLINIENVEKIYERAPKKAPNATIGAGPEVIRSPSFSQINGAGQQFSDRRHIPQWCRP